MIEVGISDADRSFHVAKIGRHPSDVFWGRYGIIVGPEYVHWGRDESQIVIRRFWRSIYFHVFPCAVIEFRESLPCKQKYPNIAPNQTNRNPQISMWNFLWLYQNCNSAVREPAYWLILLTDNDDWRHASKSSKTTDHKLVTLLWFAGLYETNKFGIKLIY